MAQGERPIDSAGNFSSKLKKREKKPKQSVSNVVLWSAPRLGDSMFSKEGNSKIFRHTTYLK